MVMGRRQGMGQVGRQGVARAPSARYTLHMFRLFLPLLLACGSDIKIGAVSVDADDDGYDQTVDCDDGRKDVNPTAPELCDGRDNDCDGEADEDPVDGSTWFADGDGDGYGDPSAGESACEAPEGSTSDSTDCDDADADDHPGGTEMCNDDDEDCDGEIDEDAADMSTVYADMDGDGHGDHDAALIVCDVPDSYVADDTDCDDSDADIHPDAEETDCTDPTDYNCDGSVAYVDADADGWVACEECDDSTAARNPGNPEVCDGAVDEDCDGLIDDDDPSVIDSGVWYADADSDGWGDADRSTNACEAPAGHVADPGDCDDDDAERAPDLVEICDPMDKDEDCDGLADDDDPDATGEASWITDGDGDGYGGESMFACESPPDVVSLDGDCDDGDSTISPAGEETCEDGVDQDCDGLDSRCALHGDFGEIDAFARVLGPSANAGFPNHTLGVGDQDGDGADDLMILWERASDTAYYQGAAYVFRGPLAGDYMTSDADATVLGAKSGYRLRRGARAGDVDGDGYDDVLFGSYLASPHDYTYYEGAAWIMQGPLSGTTSTSAADSEISGGAEYRYAARNVEGLGDLDGDGLDDFGVGSGGAATSSADELGIFYGPASGSLDITAGDVVLHGERDTDGIGAMAGRTDLDGDGVGDLLVGALFNGSAGSGSGAAYLLTGPLSSGDLGSLYTRCWSGDAVDDWLGSEVSAPGDLDGDGHEDMVVVGYQDGAVYVIYGDASAPASGAISGAASARIELDYYYTELLSQAPAGDLDGDGDTELYVSDWHDDTAASEAGLVGLFDAPLGSLAPGDAEVTFAGDGADDLVGRAANALDMNDDSYPDTVLGVYGHDAAATDAGAVLLFAP